MPGKATVHITYSTTDINQNPAILDDILNILETNGYDVWCGNPRFIKPHPSFDVQIFEQARSREVCLALLGEYALQSPWVVREIENARAGDATLVPIIIDDFVQVDDLKRFWLQDYNALRYDDDDQLLRRLPAIVDDAARGARETRLSRMAKGTIFGQPDTSAAFQCDLFMAMPFRDELNPVYEDHIKPLVKSLGYEIKRGDDPFSKHDIMRDVWSLTYNAKLIIADCTDKNPNVFYEMGIAHTLGKPVIPITQKAEDVPFDIRQRRYIPYTYTPPGMKKFEQELQDAIQSILSTP